MFNFNDLFQWERFITPSIIKIFYWLAVGVAVLFGLSGLVTAISLMSVEPDRRIHHADGKPCSVW